jgi:hypothetical protein
MTLLTIEALRENPRNVILQELPQHPSRVLVRLALMAADYVRRTEGMLMWSARKGTYTPAWWRPGEIQPDVHEDSEQWLLNANDKFEQIALLLADEFCELSEKDLP